MNEEIANQIDQIRRAWDSVQFGKENLSKGLTNLFKTVTEVYPQQISIEMAIERLRWELQKDKQPGSYYDTWKHNIANCFYDAYKHRHQHDDTLTGLAATYEIANNAAIHFLEILCQQTQSNIGLIKQTELQQQQSQPPQQ